MPPAPGFDDPSASGVPQPRGAVFDDAPDGGFGKLTDGAAPAKASSRGRANFRLSGEFKFRAMQIRPTIQHDVARFAKPLGAWMRDAQVSEETVMRMMDLYFSQPHHILRLDARTRPCWDFLARRAFLHERVTRAQVPQDITLPAEIKAARRALLDSAE